MSASQAPASPTLRSRFARASQIPEDLVPAAAALCALVALRFAVAGLTPLSSDEAYYWLWSRHFSAGYLDHPPAIAWLIRLGTLFFGDTSFGVRFGTVLASALATLFVWRTAVVLGDERLGVRAALFFNLTLMVGVEMLAATPDAPALLAASAFLYALVRVKSSVDGRWWLAVGVAGGVALLSKFTAFFLAGGVLLWLVADPEARRWLRSPWPYAGAVLALIIDAPNLWWNATHGWATFAFQFARVDAGQFTLRFLLEFLAAQIGLCTPFIFVLGVVGIAKTSRNASWRVIAALLWPGIAYFIVHSLHDRVQANWPSFLFPMLAAAAALAERDAVTANRFLRFSARAAVPVAAVLLALVYAQALFGIFPIGRSDPLSRLLAVGLGEVTDKVDAQATSFHARGLITTDYASAAWFGFYSRAHLPVVATNEDERWTYAPKADRALLSAPLLYIAEKRYDRHALLAAHFSSVEPLGEIDRRRGNVVIARYTLYRVAGLKGAPFGYVLP
jgi:4-amino-4-deoxy-L-arabinose transferase-like glycosyltransferase